MKTIKKYFSLAILLSVSQCMNAQWITNITVSPSNPTTTDTIRVYTSCNFPSGNCDEHTQTLFYSMNDISASALHCIGILTFICSATDTFIIPPLAAGTYNFKFHLDAGGLPSPCTPGIAPGPTDSVQFVVTTASGIPTENEFFNNFQIITGDIPGHFILNFPKGHSSLAPLSVSIFSVTGTKIKMIEVTSDGSTLDLTSLNGGVYIARINGVKWQSGIKIVIPDASGIQK